MAIATQSNADFVGNPISRENILDREIRVLRALCAGQMPAAARGRFARELAGYAWRQPDHRVICRALEKEPEGQNGAFLRETLPAEATRMGFPDIDWALYFTGPEETQGDLERLVHELIAASPEDV